MSEKRPGSQPPADSPKRQRSNVDIDRSLLADRLIEWFTESEGWLSPDVRVADSVSHGFHLVALRRLTSPIVVECPLKLSLSFLNLDPSQPAVPVVDSQLQRCLGEIPDHVLTYLLLAEQRSLAEKGESRWGPYIACLPEPQDMTTTLWFDDEDMKYLAGTNLVGATRDRLRELQDEYEQAAEVMAAHGIPNPDPTLFRWAANIMSSRSFISTQVLPDKETFPILFPVVDILNHSAAAKVEWEFHPYKDFVVKIVDHDQISRGEEIFNNYGPKQNDELLMGYGFCIPNNPIEQLAIRIVLPPGMEELAKQNGLYSAEQVAFGMPKTFLEGDPNKGQYYLRARGHPFGRWENNVPFLQGIPHWIVHIFFITSLIDLGIEPDTVEKDRPAARVVLEVLLKLYEAIRRKSQLMPDLEGLESASPGEKQSEATHVSEQQLEKTSLSEKQRYAAIYREGQARIIHSLRKELEAVIDRLRVTERVQKPPSRPVIITTTEALMALAAEYPEYSTSFEGATRETPEYFTELELWKTVLFVFLSLSIQSVEDSKLSDGGSNLIHDWIRALLDMHPLSSDPLGNLNLGFVRTLPRYVDPKISPITALNTLGASINREPHPGISSFLALGDGDWSRLGDQVAVWADEVVDRFSFRLAEEDRAYMYIFPWRDGESDDGWVYEEI